MHHNAKLILNGENVKLTIGEGYETEGAQLYTLPNFLFEFSTDGTQELTIMPNSSMYYSGYVNDNIGTGNLDGHFNGVWTGYSQFAGKGKISLIGHGYSHHWFDETFPPPGLEQSASLHILGGAVFRLSETISFHAENSLINLKYSQRITPASGNPNIVNPNETGRIYFHGPANIEWSYVKAAIPNETEKRVFFIKPCINSNCSTSVGLTTQNVLFDNTVEGGAAVLDMIGNSFGGSTGINKSSNIQRGMFRSFGLNIYNPSKPVTVNEVNFSSMLTNGISLVRPGTPAFQHNYEDIRITNNTFIDFLVPDKSAISCEYFDENALIETDGVK